CLDGMPVNHSNLRIGSVCNPQPTQPPKCLWRKFAMRLGAGRPRSMAICTALLFVGFAMSMAAQSYTVVDVPAASATWLVSINNGGDVAGYFCQSPSGFCQDNQVRGFVRAANGNITVFDGIPTSINDVGTVTGYFFNTTGLHNFLRDQ